MAPGAKTKPSVPNVAASLQTTGDDFARFLEAVLSGARLRRDTARLWFEPQVHLHDMEIAWGLGWGLETKSGTFFQWGDDDRGRFKAFAMGSMQQRCATVVLTNGFHGMAIMPELIGKRAEFNAFDVLLAAPATTLPGILAKLAYLQDVAERDVWMFDDRTGSATLLLEGFAASIANVSAVLS
jgi:CubicO group peptidase (beta-lactamase class C family)